MKEEGTKSIERERGLENKTKQNKNKQYNTEVNHKKATKVNKYKYIYFDMLSFPYFKTAIQAVPELQTSSVLTSDYKSGLYVTYGSTLASLRQMFVLV